MSKDYLELLITACREGESRMVAHYTKEILKSGNPQDIFAWGKNGKTALHAACEAGKFQSAKTILTIVAKQNPDFLPLLLNAIDEQGNTPLHSAAQKMSGGSVKALAEFGADLLAKNNEGLTPFALAEKTLLASADQNPIARIIAKDRFQTFGAAFISSFNKKYESPINIANDSLAVLRGEISPEEGGFAVNPKSDRFSISSNGSSLSSASAGYISDSASVSTSSSKSTQSSVSSRVSNYEPYFLRNTGRDCDSIDRETGNILKPVLDSFLEKCRTPRKQMEPQHYTHAEQCARKSAQHEAKTGFKAPPTPASENWAAYAKATTENKVRDF